MEPSVDIGLEFYFDHRFSEKRPKILMWYSLFSFFNEFIWHPRQILNYMYIRGGLYMDKKNSKFLRAPAHTCIKLNVALSILTPFS